MLLLRNIVGGAGPGALELFKSYLAAEPLRAWRLTPRFSGSTSGAGAVNTPTGSGSGSSGSSGTNATSAEGGGARGTGKGGAAAVSSEQQQQWYPMPTVIPRVPVSNANAVVAFDGLSTNAAAAGGGGEGGRPASAAAAEEEEEQAVALAVAAAQGAAEPFLSAANLTLAAERSADTALQVGAAVAGALAQAALAWQGQDAAADQKHPLFPIIFTAEPASPQPASPASPIGSPGVSLVTPLVVRSDTSGLRDIVSASLARGGLKSERLLQPGEGCE